MSTEQIKEYYDELAAHYDENRFQNAYGQYIDRQERNFLDRTLKSVSPTQCLDLGCGTGRLLNYADYGVDFSEEMLKVAQQKYPHKTLLQGELTQIPFEDSKFEVIFSFHVIMHQDMETTKKFVEHAHQKLKQGGKLIFDFPSQKRRKQVKHQQHNWHAANQISISDIEKMLTAQWKLKFYQGFLFFPIHRIPTRFRPLFLNIDNLLCRSPLKEYASYLVVILEKQ
ncbi:class I SAM-dependent methyltransferase [Acinetobacter sp. 194]|uniref:class I SAM-dependent DNA methyltransferase n=1 Tax=Acinetobacter shaoyimingii TaxID=2715164 RepID=UPI00140CD281|nr:class I SAM-dependent methyltransferase [Acinetobacter shaoyimingii]NHB56883.1 class I SAM-dependent methyltransferase [Acinetobacter shaoyimingii]